MGALCLSSCQARRGGQDRHQAPTTPPFHSLSLHFRRPLPSTNLPLQTPIPGCRDKIGNVLHYITIASWFILLLKIFDVQIAIMRESLYSSFQPETSSNCPSCATVSATSSAARLCSNCETELAPMIGAVMAG